MLCVGNKALQIGFGNASYNYDVKIVIYYET